MKYKRNPSFILASASPRRRSILKKAGYRFRIVPADVSERFDSSWGPRRIARALALKKASAVAAHYPHIPVLGADTIVYINGHVVGKPRNPAHAATILKELAGSWQRVYTGVAVVHRAAKKSVAGVAMSKVKMRPLGDADINRLCHKHLDKAGAYAVQAKKDRFVEKIVGDYDNVVGLPLRMVKKLLR